MYKDTETEIDLKKKKRNRSKESSRVTDIGKFYTKLTASEIEQVACGQWLNNCWGFTEPRSEQRRPLREILHSVFFPSPRVYVLVAEKIKMKNKMLYILLIENMSQVFQFYPFPCVSWPEPVFSPVHPALLGAGSRIPLSLRIWNKMSASSYPHLFLAGGVRSRTKVDLISGPACRHLRTIRGKLLPVFPTFCDAESSHFLLPSLAVVNFHFSTSFRTGMLLEGIHPSL